MNVNLESIKTALYS